jgi:hypothetical protein
MLIFTDKTVSQEKDLLKLVNDSLPEAERHGVRSIFKATQLINLPTVEGPAKRSLQFLIMHRFGKLNEGAYELFGLDNASIRFGLDYGITDKLSVGIGRNSLDKNFDGSIKYRILQQKVKRMPVAVSVYAVASHYTLKIDDKPYLNSRYRTSYTTQLLVARKFTSNLSFQLVPSWIHFNMVPTAADKNDVFALSAGGRMKFTKRMSINLEYNYLLPDQLLSTDYDQSLSLGIDIETGGHVFQLVFSNSQGMISPYYNTKTIGNWSNGDIYFGFNVSRIFNFKRKQ